MQADRRARSPPSFLVATPRSSDTRCRGPGLATAADLREGGTQNSMTSDDLVEGTLKHGNIQWACEAPTERAIIRRIARILPVGSPNPLLRRRKGESKIELVVPGFPVFDLPAC